MDQPTDIRMQFTFATVQMVALPLDEADFRLPADEFARLVHANERAELGKLFVHKAQGLQEKVGAEPMQGALQSALYDIDQSDGIKELRELIDAVKTTVLERFYPVEERRVVG